MSPAESWLFMASTCLLFALGAVYLGRWIEGGNTMKNPDYLKSLKWQNHIGHNVVCVGYGPNNEDPIILEVAIECDDCGEVLESIPCAEEIIYAT